MLQDEPMTYPNERIEHSVIVSGRLHQNDPSGRELEENYKASYICLAPDTTWEAKPVIWEEPEPDVTVQRS
jgi:hypothetical protein